jgi:monoamine oxidase
MRKSFIFPGNFLGIYINILPVKRRKALRQIGLGFSAGLMLPSLLSACKDDDPSPTTKYNGVVGVIGAGAAGLHAADILRTNGIPVRVFEASGRVGGRVRTMQRTTQPDDALLFDPNNLPVSEFPAEFGASFISGSDSAWGKIADQLNAPLIEFYSQASDVFIVDGTVKTAADLQSDADFIAAQNFVSGLASNSSTSSVEQAIASAGINARMYAILNSWLGNKAGTSNSLLGTKALAEAIALRTRNDKQYILQANPMEDALLSRFDSVIQYVELNTAIKSVNYTTDKIVLTGDKNGTESFTAEVDRLVVAVPVSILKAGTIVFTPSLPSAKTTALSRMDMDASIRVRLEFRKNFWGMNSAFIYGGTQAPEYFNAGIGRDAMQKTLDITIQGPKAEELSAKGKDMVPVILSELDAVFNGQATENVRRDAQDTILSVIMDWTKVPYIRGGASYIKPGGSNADRISLSEPVNDKVFFAGEATDIAGEAGTISGAIQSAERAASEVMETIELS